MNPDQGCLRNQANGESLAIPWLCLNYHERIRIIEILEKLNENLVKIHFRGLTYLVSSNGIIWSIKRGELKQRISDDGYAEVTMGIGKQRCSRIKVHRIVAMTFIPNPENKPEVNHKDFNRLNNDVSNLEWVTHQENITKSAEAGRYNGALAGEKNGRANLTWDIVRKVRKDAELNKTVLQISRARNIPPTTVYNIIHNITWKE